MTLVALAMMFVLFLKGRQTGITSGPTALSSEMTGGSIVMISGDVAHPGIYRITDKKMTNSVIQMSEPFCDGLPDSVDAELSTRLHTGNELLIACKGPDNRPFIRIEPMKSSQCLTLGIPLDLNRMSAADLELLPGIGPVLAGKIVNLRQKIGEFKGVDDLLQIEGIGEKKFKKISRYFKAPIQQKKTEQ